MKKNNLLLLFIFILLAFSYSGIAHALEVSSYPTINGITLTADSKFPEYVIYLFSLLIYIAGAIAAISFAVGAVLYIVSGDNPTTSSSAKDRMRGSVLGLVLTLSAFILLKTINPALVNPSLAPLTTLPTAPKSTSPGVYFYLDSGCTGASSGPYFSSTSDFGEKFNGNIKSVKLVSDPDKNVKYAAILHSAPSLSMGGWCSDPIVQNDACEGVNLSVFSADIVVLNTTPKTTSSGDGIVFYSEPFGPTRGTSAGFYTMSNEDIFTALPFKKSADSLCFNYTNIIVKESYKRNCSGGSCGQEDQTCKEPKDCKNGKNCENGICVSMAPGSVPNCSLNGCTSFQDCPRSAQIKGNYLLGLYSEQYCNDSEDCDEGDVCKDNRCEGAGRPAMYCQTFTKDNLGINNFSGQPIIASGSVEVNGIFVIPYK